MQILLKKIASLGRGRKILILIFPPVLLLGLYWFFSLQHSLQEINQFQDSIQSLKKDISIYKQQSQQLPELKNELQERQQELVYARTLLPQSMHDVERLLAEIEQLGKEINVDFLLFEPGSEEIHDFYATLTVNLHVQGQFHNLMEYFSQMSRLDTLVTLENLRLEPENYELNQSPQLTAPAQIAVYRALTEQELQEREQ